MNALIDEQRIKRVGFISITPKKLDQIAAVHAGILQPDLYFLCRSKLGQCFFQELKPFCVIAKHKLLQHLAFFRHNTAVVLFRCDVQTDIKHGDVSFSF